VLEGGRSLPPVAETKIRSFPVTLVTRKVCIKTWLACNDRVSNSSFVKGQVLLWVDKISWTAKIIDTEKF